MKKLLLLLPVALLATAAWLYADATMHGNAAKAESAAEMEAHRVLIAYYSWGGTTRHAAEEIQRCTGGTLLEIKPVTPYPEDYDACVQKAKEDIKAGVKPDIIPANTDIALYDTIFIGSPNWWSTIAPPVSTFLSQNDLSGKKVAFFQTHGGGGMANCERHARALMPKATFLGSISLRDLQKDSFAEAVSAWVKSLRSGSAQ